MRSFNRDNVQHQKPKVPIPPQPAEKELPLIENQHKLREAWTLTHAPPRTRDVTNFESSMQELATFETVEQFWSVYSHVKRPSKVEMGTDFYLFKSGIKPMWEDPANERGGRITFRLGKHRSTKAWEELVLAAIGGRLTPDDQVCGLVIGVRYINMNKHHHNNNHHQPQGEDVLSIWTRDAQNKEAVTSITEAVRSALKLPDHMNLDYKEHDSAWKKALEVAAQKEETPEGETQLEATPAVEVKADNFW